MTDHLEADREAAGAWYARLRAQDSESSDHRAFADWLAAAPRHRLAYADICAAALALEQAYDAMPVDDAMPAAVIAVAPRAIARTARARMHAGRFGWIAGAAAALALALGLSQGMAPWQNLTSDAYTKTAEQRWIELEDGSRVLLDADSAIDIEYAATARNVRLVRGAALFEVAKDSRRPFTVRAGDVQAEALGTQYAVEHSEAGVRVAVREGVVGVSAHGATASRLEGGQAITVAAGLQPSSVESLEPEAFDWTEGRMVFSGTPLKRALARLDRQVPGRVVLWADDRGDAPVTAAIPAGGARAGLEAVVREQGLKFTEVPGFGIVIHE